MATTMADLERYVENEFDRAMKESIGDATLVELLQPIRSHLHIIAGAQTLADQKAGCQQLSAALLLIHRDLYYHNVRDNDTVRYADVLDKMRVEIAQFGFMGR